MIMEERYFYICDKKPGACGGWKHGWKKCINEFCLHTSNVEHAKYKNESGRKFAIVKQSEEKTIFFEILGACVHPCIKCQHQITAGPNETKLCTENDCPAWQLRE